MKLPRVRFTVRRMMVAVAVLALAVGWWKQGERRRARFRALAIVHLIEANEPTDYHGRTAVKYMWATRYPWLPVAPDPPEPK
jgi:hypothetical protein